MKTIKVVNEAWFSTAPLADIVDLGMREFDIDPIRFDKKDERQKRALVRQVFKQRDLKYGAEFELDEKAGKANPFARKSSVKLPKERMSVSNLKGQYRVVKCRMRANDNDEKWNLWLIVAQNTDFETCLAKLHEKYADRGPNPKFNSSGALQFTLESFVAWAVTCGWIVRV
jgi:hypothetical protein